MATLEKIRSQQKLLFTIVIIALFLFIISIASADSIRRIFGPGTTIAKVGGQKIDYEDYRQAIEEANRNQQQYDRDVLSQMVIQQLIQKKLFEEQYDQLGINVTDAQIGHIMTSENPPREVAQFIAQASQALQLPMANGATLLDAINNPTRYNLTPDQLNMIAQRAFGTPTMADAWVTVEQMVENGLKQQALGRLINGLFTANELDAQSMHTDNSTISTISYVSAPFNMVPDDGVEVSDADLKAKWEELKSQFKIAEEIREVDFIAVPIVPSADDYNTAELEVDNLVESLMANSGVEGAVLSSKFVHDSKNLPLADVKRDADLRLIPDSLLKKEGVYKYNRTGNNFRVAKIIDVAAVVDTIDYSIYMAQTKAMADSVYNLLAQGKTFKEIAADSPQVAADSIKENTVGGDKQLVDVLLNATLGQPFVYTDSTRNANLVLKVNKRNAPREYVDAVIYSYTVDPSATTVSNIKTDLSSFLASNSKGDAFSANADSLYTLRHSTISASTPNLGMMNNARGGSGFSDTRHAIKWAMNAKKGEVSPIFDDNRDYYVVAAVKDIFEGEYIPYNADQVKAQLEPLVKADKKAQKLTEKYKGKASDINGYAKLMGANVQTDSTIVFASPFFATFRGDVHTLQGQAAAAKKGAVVGPVQGPNEVVVFVVTDSKDAGRPYNFTQDGSAFMTTFGIKDYLGMFVGDRKITNNSLKFENYDK